MFAEFIVETVEHGIQNAKVTDSIPRKKKKFTLKCNLSCFKPNAVHLNKKTLGINRRCKVVNFCISHHTRDPFVIFQFPLGFGVNVDVLPNILARCHQRLWCPSAFSASLMIKGSRLLYMLVPAVNTFLC